MNKKSIWIAALIALFISTTSAMGKVSGDEAARLGKDLTPFGSEKAGNEAGTIPAWNGGLTPDKAPADWKAPNGHRPDPYPTDKPLFTITAVKRSASSDASSAPRFLMVSILSCAASESPAAISSSTT